MFNHSCDPNCAMSRDVSPMRVITTRAVQPGEELTVSYIQTAAPRSTRQAQLLEGYRFVCACSRCASDGDRLTQDEASSGGRADGNGGQGHVNSHVSEDQAGRQPQHKKRTKAELRARREERQRDAAAKLQQQRGQAEPELEPEQPMQVVADDIDFDDL